jgi:putative membrane protein
MRAARRVPPTSSSRSALGTALTCGAVALIGLGLWWISSRHPGRMPVWAPWDFSPAEYLVAALGALWFFRGLALQSPEARPRPWRRAAFLAGLASIYLVLQTRYDYWAQHLFCLNRIQHVMMHHVGPFLIAVGAVGDTVKRGMPGWVRRIVEGRAVGAVMRVLQQPVLAGVLFVGSFFFWLIPPVHFAAMISARLYQLMNWTMVVDGLLFWALALDMRPRPPARISYRARVGLVIAVMIPQALLGSVLTVWPKDIYTYYDLCGRLVPWMSALTDQHLAGAVVWIPPGFLGMGGVLLLTIAMKQWELRRGARSDSA